MEGQAGLKGGGGKLSHSQHEIWQLCKPEYMKQAGKLFPHPQASAPVRSYRTWPPSALHCSQSCPVSENSTCLSEWETFFSMGSQDRAAEGKTFLLLRSQYQAASDGCAWNVQSIQVLLSFVSLFLPVENSAAGNFWCSLPLTAAWTDCNMPDCILQQHFTPTFGKSTYQHPSGA